MKQKIIESLSQRINEELRPQNPVSILKEIPIDLIYSSLISNVYLYTRVDKGSEQPIYMADVITAIGRKIMSSHKMKLDSALAAKIGAFALYTLERYGVILVCMTKGRGKHGSYAIEVIEDNLLAELWEEIPTTHVEKLPSLEPYADWTSGIHATGVPMVKTQANSTIKQLSPESQPLVFKMLNKSQHVGWQINDEIYNLHLWALRNKTAAFQEIWDMENPVARQSKIREAKAIGSIAKRFLGKVFYH